MQHFLGEAVAILFGGGAIYLGYLMLKHKPPFEDKPIVIKTPGGGAGAKDKPRSQSK